MCRLGSALPLLGGSLLLLLACGGGSAQRADGAKSTPTEAAAPAGSGPLSEEECMRLLDHYLELAMAEKRASLPAEEVPTAEQVARIRVSMRGQARDACVGQTERAEYDCAMRAATTRALGACLARPEGG